MSEGPKPDITVDCIGLYCPMPILKTREAIDKMDVGQLLELFADDPASEDDVKYFAKSTGHEIIKIEKKEGEFRFLIKKIK
jgi:TusA-related sulfurtransferase